jgi:hypothetical protein
VVSFTPRPLYPLGKHPPAGWTPRDSLGAVLPLQTERDRRSSVTYVTHGFSLPETVQFGAPGNITCYPEVLSHITIVVFWGEGWYF